MMSDAIISRKNGKEIPPKTKKRNVVAKKTVEQPSVDNVIQSTDNIRSTIKRLDLIQSDRKRTAVYDYGKTIDHFRREKEMSQKDLANLCGLSVSYISEIINKKKIPETQTLEMICFELGVSMPVFYLKAMKRLPDDNLERQSDNDHIRSLLLGLSELLDREENPNFN